MALVIMNNGIRRQVTTPAAVKIWQALSGEIAPTKDQAAFISQVKQVHLNWHVAPDSYIKANLHNLMPSILNEWAVDTTGKPHRPATDRALSFAKHYGLWKHDKPTELVTNYKDKKIWANQKLV